MTNWPPEEGNREEWFLARLDEDPIDTGLLLRFLDALRAEGAVEQAESWTELLQDTLIDRQLPGKALRVLSVRAIHAGTGSSKRVDWRGTADRALEHMHEQRKFVDHAGFDKGVPPAEAVRRLLLMLALKPGVLCLEKTWGFGVVKKVDTFYGRVEIDFDKKSEHQMSLAYAAETVALLDESHVFARIYNQPDELKTMAVEDPGAVVRLALESLGPLTVTQLHDALVPRLLAEADWKKFWEGARRNLKKDPLVDIPSKRTDPISLLKKERAYDDEWFAAFGAERDMRTVVRLVDELVQNAASLENESHRRAVGDRLAFVIKGAGYQYPSLLAQSVMHADRLGVDPSMVDVRAHAALFLKDETFLRVTEALPARCVGPFLELLTRYDRPGTDELLLRVLRRMSMVTLNESIAYLLTAGLESRVADILRESVLSQKAEVECLYWMSRNPDRMASWSLGSLPALIRLIVLDLDRGYTGERLKVRNQLRSRLEQSEFLKSAMDQMTVLQREEIMQFIRVSGAWTALDRQSLLGQIIKMYPDMQRVLTTDASKKEGPAYGPITSHRSYVERQKQLEKIVTVDIPQNTKEIAIARSYGDLSENHEFKAAKEMQGILLRRRGELETMLQRVSSTDFAGFEHDRVGAGTGVAIAYADGRQERYHILGEWDKDENLGIISNETRMAKALEGHVAGDEVVVPTESGETTCRVVEVTELPADVKKWILGDG